MIREFLVPPTDTHEWELERMMGQSRGRTRHSKPQPTYRLSSSDL